MLFFNGIIKKKLKKFRYKRKKMNKIKKIPLKINFDQREIRKKKTL